MTRRATLSIHCLTEREARSHSDFLGIDRSLARVIPWAFMREPAPLPEPGPSTNRVVSSGRASCDWETLFAAARGAEWSLTVICSEAELQVVRDLAAGVGAQVECELPRAEHDRLVEAADLYVLPLRAAGPSSGHLRIMAAAGAGTAVLTSDVPGLEGYLDPGVTAELVPPGDPSRLREAIDRLMADPQRRRQLAAAAHQRGLQRTYDDYFAEIEELLAC